MYKKNSQSSHTRSKNGKVLRKDCKVGLWLVSRKLDLKRVHTIPYLIRVNGHGGTFLQSQHSGVWPGQFIKTLSQKEKMDVCIVSMKA